MAALCQKIGRFYSLRVDWLVKPDEQKRTTKTGLFALSNQKRGKPACGERLALLSIGGQSFGTKRPFFLTHGMDTFGVPPGQARQRRVPCDRIPVVKHLRVIWRHFHRSFP